MEEQNIDWSLLTATPEEVDEQPTSRLEQLMYWNEPNNDHDLRREMMDMLEDGRQYYDGLYTFRSNRKKAREFVRGNQYIEVITDPDDSTKTITEEELLLRKGRQPIVNNQIRQIHKNLKGQYRDNDYKPSVRARKTEDQRVSEMLTAALQYAHDVNNSKEVDAAVFDEFLLSGAAVWMTGFEWKADRNIMDLSVDPMNPARMWWNTDVEHPLLTDMHTIGIISDVPLDVVLQNFGHDDEAAEQYIRDMYPGYQERASHYQNFGPDKIDALYFYVNTHENSKEVRVFEIWRKEYKNKAFAYDPVRAEYIQYDGTAEEGLMQIQLENEERLMIAEMQGIDPSQVPLLEPEIRKERVWMYYYTTPYGHVLDMGESPYWHEEHPYTIKLWPMIDSQVWGLLQDFLDQQKMINRTITMLDHVMGTSAKNTLLIPEDIIPEGMTEDDFAEQHTRIGGYVVYKPRPHGQIPQEISSNSRPANAIELLKIEMEMLQQTSGINNAIQGQKVSGVNTASQYAQMANNATLNVKDPFEAFFDGRKMKDWKCVKLIQQFYDEPRYLNITGGDYAQDSMYYDPEIAGDVEFDMVIAKSANAPVYRDMIEERLLELLQSGAIPVDIYLEHSTLPFSDKIRQSVQQYQQKAAQQQMMLGEGQE